MLMSDVARFISPVPNFSIFFLSCYDALPRAVIVMFVPADVAVITKSAVNMVPVIPLVFQILQGRGKTCVPLDAVALPLVTLISRE